MVEPDVVIYLQNWMYLLKSRYHDEYTIQLCKYGIALSQGILKTILSSYILPDFLLIKTIHEKSIIWNWALDSCVFKALVKTSVRGLQLPKIK